MNPLTQVKKIQKLNSTEASLGISDEASWHARYKDSAYVFVGGIPFDLTEGDLLAVFAQYGEVVDVNLIRDKATGKSRGFAFLAYEDQRSTILAVDNLNGGKVLGRIIRVDHVSNYKKKEEEDEEEQQRKREERGVCRAFQRGECNRGASCKFSHNEQRAADTGWGPKESDSRWDHDKYADNPRKDNRRHKDFASGQALLRKDDNDRFKPKTEDRDGRFSRSERAKESGDIHKKEDDRNWNGDRRERDHKDGRHHQEDVDKRSKKHRYERDQEHGNNRSSDDKYFSYRSRREDEERHRRSHK